KKLSSAAQKTMFFVSETGDASQALEHGLLRLGREVVVVVQFCQDQPFAGGIEVVDPARVLHTGLHVLKGGLIIDASSKDQHRPRRQHGEDLVVIVGNLLFVRDKRSQLRQKRQ